MNEYDYFIAGFQSTDAEYLRQLIVSQPSLAPTYSTMDTASATVEGVDGYNVSVFFTAPLSDPAQTLLAGLASTYMVSVPVAKIKKMVLLASTVQDFIESKYNLTARQQFLALYILGKIDGLTTRTNYIRPGIDWINAIFAYAVSAGIAIQALTTIEAVTAFTIDVAGAVGANPNLTLAAAGGITTVEPVVSTPSRDLDTNFTPNANHLVMGFYTIRIVTALLTPTGSVELMSDTNSTPNTVRSRVAVTVSLNQTQDLVLSYLVPKGHNVRLASAGTATISIINQSEVVITAT